MSTVPKGLVDWIPLTAEARATLYALASRPLGLEPLAEIDDKRAGNLNWALILSGWACEKRDLMNGGRQIFSFLLPGDLIEIGPENYTISALTVVRIANVTALFSGQEEGSSTDMVSRVRRLKTERLFQHVARLGGLNGYRRLGHLLLELHDRLALVGLARDGSFALPISQEALGDSLGLTTVHVNRTLQRLRADGFLKVSLGRIELLNLHVLRRVTGYLNNANLGGDAFSGPPPPVFDPLFRLDHASVS